MANLYTDRYEIAKYRASWMPRGPVVAPDRPLGYRAVIETEHVDTVIALPDDLHSVIVAFTALGGPAEGRIAFADDDTAIETLTGTDTLMGYCPAVPLSYLIPIGSTHLHVAGLIADTTVSITWLF